MSGKIDFKVGNSVIVKAGVLDPDLGIDIGGWQGRVSEIDQQNNLIGIDWDSITLKNMPEGVIEKCELEGWNWSTMFLESTEVELTQSRDTEKDVASIFEQIESQHRWSYLGEEGKGIQAVLASVDSDDEMEALRAWKEHFKKVLSFPFEAVVSEFQDRGPLRSGDKVMVRPNCPGGNAFAAFLLRSSINADNTIFPFVTWRLLSKTPQITAF